MKLFIVLLMVIPSILSENIFLLDLSPEEAQKYLSEQSPELSYSKKLAENTLVQGRDIDGTARTFYWNGKVIDNPEDYIEETYEAKQFHGQDGLGRAMFGYTDWNQGRFEARNANGDVKGSYQYVDPNGENYVVNYWSDGLGFHHMDNRPEVKLQPATDSPEVAAARAAHEEAWNKAAEAAKANPDPNSDVYNRNANRLDQEQAEADHAQEIIAGVANQGQSLTRHPSLPYSQHIKPNDNVGSSSDTVVVNSAAAPSVLRRQVSNAEEEVTGPPRGFFYSFEHPASIIVENPARSAKSAVARKRRDVNKPDQVPVKVIIEAEPIVKYVKSKKTAETKGQVNLDAKPAIKSANTENDGSEGLVRISLKASEGGAIPIDAIHDAQVHPNQKEGIVNSQVLPVYIHD